MSISWWHVAYLCILSQIKLESYFYKYCSHIPYLLTGIDILLHSWKKNLTSVLFYSYKACHFYGHLTFYYCHHFSSVCSCPSVIFLNIVHFDHIASLNLQGQLEQNFAGMVFVMSSFNKMAAVSNCCLRNLFPWK